MLKNSPQDPVIINASSDNPDKSVDNVVPNNGRPWKTLKQV